MTIRYIRQSKPSPNTKQITTKSPAQQKPNQKPASTPEDANTETPPTYPFPAYSIVKQHTYEKNIRETVVNFCLDETQIQKASSPMPCRTVRVVSAWSGFYASRTPCVNALSHTRKLPISASFLTIAPCNLRKPSVFSKAAIPLCFQRMTPREPFRGVVTLTLGRKIQRR